MSVNERNLYEKDFVQRSTPQGISFPKKNSSRRNACNHLISANDFWKLFWYKWSFSETDLSYLSCLHSKDLCNQCLGYLKTLPVVKLLIAFRWMLFSKLICITYVESSLLVFLYKFCSISVLLWGIDWSQYFHFSLVLDKLYSMHEIHSDRSQYDGYYILLLPWRCSLYPITSFLSKTELKTHASESDSWCISFCFCCHQYPCIPFIFCIAEIPLFPEIHKRNCCPWHGIRPIISPKTYQFVYKK